MPHIWSLRKGLTWRRTMLERRVCFLLELAAAGTCTETEAGWDEGPEQVRPAGNGEPPRRRAHAALELSSPRAAGSDVIVQSVEVDGQLRWALLCCTGASVRRNGAQVDSGLVMLQDQDEIVVRDHTQQARFYFSSEELAEVAPAPAGVTVNCPRCKSDIEAGTPSVKCGRCGALHHQREDRPCWTYTELCGACHQQPTTLSGEPSWTPEQL